MSKLHEDDKGWRDTRVIDAETLRQLDRDMLKGSEMRHPDKSGEGDTSAGNEYEDAGCPR